MTTLRNAPGVRAVPASWPLTPIEELDLYLENAAEPSLIGLETPVQGHLDPAVLDSALADALAADPAARRHLGAASSWSRRLRWEADGPACPAGTAAGGRPVPGRDAGLLTVAGWRTAGQLAALRERLSAWPIPLRDHAVRLILAAGPEHDVVILQTHHAAFDGVSSLALLTAISAAYRERAANLPGTGPQPAPPPPSPLSRTAGPARSGGPGRIPAALTRIAGRLPGAATRIAAQTAWPGRPGYGAAHRSVPVPRPARQGSGPFPTVNDLLVVALIRTVDRWNADHGRRSGRIRISVPVNGRDPGSRWAGPGNQSRLIRITARPREHADPGTPARARGGPDQGRQAAAAGRAGRGQQAAGHRLGTGCQQALDGAAGPPRRRAGVRRHRAAQQPRASSPTRPASAAAPDRCGSAARPRCPGVWAWAP